MAKKYIIYAFIAYGAWYIYQRSTINGQPIFGGLKNV